MNNGSTLSGRGEFSWVAIWFVLLVGFKSFKGQGDALPGMNTKDPTDFGGAARFIQSEKPCAF